MRPVDPKYAVTQGFGGMPTAGVGANSDPDSGVGYYVYLYGNYQPFGHAGADIGTPIGTPVYAMAAGTVLWADWGTNLPGDDSEWGYRQRWYLYKGFPGIVTVIQHTGWIGVYAHLNDNDAAPKGAVVKEGQLIGHSGNTGGVAPHLHVERIVDTSYRTSGDLIYGRSNPSVVWSTFKPLSSTTAQTGLFVTLTAAQEELILDRITKYVDSPISQVDEKVWATPVLRGGGKVTALQELADSKTGNIALQGQVAGLLSAIKQLAEAPGTPVDLQAVTAAAEAGAAKALSGLEANVTLKQGV